MAPNLAVIILTFNEEENIAQALGSVCGWANEVWVLDAFSTDRTVELTSEYPCKVAQHAFEDYSKQRNHALSLPIASEWIFFLDADEWMPAALKEEIARAIAPGAEHDGYYVKYRLMWMGRWIRRGYYPTWLLRLFRRGKARCEARGVNEHVMVDGKLGQLNNDLIHEDRKSISRWVARHNEYATREAAELLIERPASEEVQADLFGTQTERKRWIRSRIWNRLPPLARPLGYFSYRYFLRGGFLDGKEAFVYHFMQGLWFPLLVDVKYLEMKARAAAPSTQPGRDR